jgi:hypothetical protein
MNINISELSKVEYKNLNYQILFDCEAIDRCFGVITNERFNFKFAWQSDNIKPFVLLHNKNICLLGIDQNFVVIDFSKGTVNFNTTLDYFFYDAKIFNDFLYIITELEILKLDLLKYNHVEKSILPNYFKKINFKDNGDAEIECLGSEMVMIK